MLTNHDMYGLSKFIQHLFETNDYFSEEKIRNMLIWFKKLVQYYKSFNTLELNEQSILEYQKEYNISYDILSIFLKGLNIAIRLLERTHGKDTIGIQLPFADNEEELIFFSMLPQKQQSRLLNVIMRYYSDPKNPVMIQNNKSGQYTMHNIDLDTYNQHLVSIAHTKCYI